MTWAGVSGGVPFCAFRPVKPPCCRVDYGLLLALQDLLSTLWLFRAGGEGHGGGWKEVCRKKESCTKIGAVVDWLVIIMLVGEGLVPAKRCTEIC